MIGTTETTIADNCMDRLVVLLWCAAAFRSLGACDWLITSIRRYGIVLSVFVFIKKVESYQLFQCPTPVSYTHLSFGFSHFRPLIVGLNIYEVHVFFNCQKFLEGTECAGREIFQEFMRLQRIYGEEKFVHCGKFCSLRVRKLYFTVCSYTQQQDVYKRQCLYRPAIRYSSSDQCRSV